MDQNVGSWILHLTERINYDLPDLQLMVLLQFKRKWLTWVYYLGGTWSLLVSFFFSLNQGYDRYFSRSMKAMGTHGANVLTLCTWNLPKPIRCIWSCLYASLFCWIFLYLLFPAVIYCSFILLFWRISTR